MLHFVTSYMNQNKNRKQTLENAQYGLEIIFKLLLYPLLFFIYKCIFQVQLSANRPTQLNSNRFNFHSNSYKH